MPATIKAEDLPTLIGQSFEPSPWFEVTQERVDRFADATLDHQFIHVDPERAAQTPFGGPIAHGFLTLSLLTHLTAEQARRPEGMLMGINYGSDRVRFLQPVPVGSRIRAHQRVLEVTQKRPGQWLLKTEVTVEIEDQPRPALVAELLSMLIMKT